MTTTNTTVQTTLRIPADWSHPRELLERLPAEYRLTGEALVLPDGATMEFSPLAPDDQFPQIFASSCRRPASDEEIAAVNRYTVNVALTGPGGSMDAALAMMQAGAAIVRAGGAGVFIDNCGLAHGGDHWLEMVEDGGPDALSFAFVGIVSGQQQMWTMGMHVLGFPEIVMSQADLDGDADVLVEVIRYVAAGDKPIGEGHLLCDEHGPRFQAAAIDADERTAGTPMHNPFGRLRLTSLKDIAEGN